METGAAKTPLGQNKSSQASLFTTTSVIRKTDSEGLAVASGIPMRQFRSAGLCPGGVFALYTYRLIGTLLQNPDVEKSFDFYAFNDSTAMATFNFGELSTSGFRSGGFIIGNWYGENPACTETIWRPR